MTSSPIAFVTGGTGFLGRRLIQMLIQSGWQVRALHRKPSDAARLAEIGAIPILGDLDSTRALQEGTAGATTVFHSAALFTMWAPHEAFERANVHGTRQLLTVAKEQGVGHFVQIGASGVFMGDRQPMLHVTEALPLAYPSWAPYLASKARSQALVLKANEPQGMRTSVVLPAMIWGPGMPMLDGVADDIAAGRFAWPGGGHQLASSSHVDNVSLCAMLAATQGTGGRAYLVTDGEPRPVRETITQLLAARGVKAKGRDVPLAVAWGMASLMEALWRLFRLKGQPPLTRQMLRMVGYTFIVSDQRARDELGYLPRVTWQAGIDAMRNESLNRRPIP